MTNFVPWYPLCKAKDHAPRSPGVFQVKLPSGLRGYPLGKSAMVHYGAAIEDLSADIETVARKHTGTNYLCRHQETPHPTELLGLVRQRFERRFGSCPTWPS